MDEDGVPMNCPHCGRSMTYLLGQHSWHFYDCDKCGPFTLPERGPMRPTELADCTAAGLDTRRIS